MGIFGKSEEERSDPNLDRLRDRIVRARLPEHVNVVIEREFDLLSRAGSTTSEYTIGFAYVEYLLSLPWEVRTEDVLDLARAEEILSNDHYGLGAIKERILEFLAVKRLRQSRKAHILVVDNEEIVRRNLSYVLKAEGYAVQTAASGKEALDRIGEGGYDVVLTDMKMGEVDGFTVLEKVKSRSPLTEVVMITGYASVDHAVDAMKKGAYHYIEKPLNVEDVRKVVRQAVEKRSTRMSARGPVLCFAGPPGTGKTSMGRSIARALGRRFTRVSLGGVKDEAEIRGHRRTYAGAMPGRIIDGIRRIGSLNPVIILDELDKIGRDVKGDPEAALLEVLDPEQNAHFMDHYLDVPFDLSDVMFVVTANIAENISEPLRDRLEVLRFSGYAEEEKFHIASEYLIPRQIDENGLQDAKPGFEDAAIRTLIREYTYEAGIRNLEREIAAVCRKIATLQIRNGAAQQRVTVTPQMIADFLGPRRHVLETAGEHDRIGVVTGLVWTDVGGEIIAVEAAYMSGRQVLIMTGSLGDVMRESAQTALSFIRSRAGQFGIDADFFRDHDIHVHVPAGAIPKDGPSAGLTIALALISLLKVSPARRDVAVSGELTLSGSVLPVGGVKEKLLAARRAGIGTVVLPERNRADVTTARNALPQDLDVIFVSDVSEALAVVLRA